jgi:hypothetical protein
VWRGEIGDEFLALYDRPASRWAYWKGLAAVIDVTVNPRATLWQLIGGAFDGDHTRRQARGLSGVRLNATASPARYAP